MSESFRCGSGDHNPIDSSKVHQWGHQFPINNVDHTSYNFEHDPDLMNDLDIHYNRFPVRKTSAKRVSSAGAVSGSDTERSFRTRSSRQFPKSRSRPMKSHEPEPFLAVDAMTSTSRMSSCSTSRLPQRPASSNIRKGRAPTVTGRLYVPDGRSPSPYINRALLRQTVSAPSKLRRRGRNTPASSVYVSPSSRQKPKPNVHVKSPFKHSVQKTEPPKDRPTTPSQDLKELTAFATFHVGKMLSKEPVEPKQKLYGRLLKGKLKPLKPVVVKGPSIDRCKGIVSENRNSLPPANRTLARRREILERIPNVHEFIYDRPRTEESIHQTSRASSVDENREEIIKGDLSDNEGEISSRQSKQVNPLDDLPSAPTSSRNTDQGPVGPTPTPRMFVTEINNKGKENIPQKLTANIEQKQQKNDIHDIPEENNEAKTERPNTASKLVRFADGSKHDPETSKGLKDQENSKLAQEQREGTVAMSEEPTQMEIEMKVDITIIDKSERKEGDKPIEPSKTDSKVVKGEIKVIDKGLESSPERKKSKESCKPVDDKPMKKEDDDQNDDDRIRDLNDNRYTETNQTTSSSANQNQQSQSKSAGESQKSGKQSSTVVKDKTAGGHNSRSCRSKNRYQAPSTLQIQSVLHDGSVYYTVGAESPRRSPSPTRSPSPFSSHSSSTSKSKHNRLIRPSSATKRNKPVRKSSQSSEGSLTLGTYNRSDSPSRKVYFEGETPPRESLFVEEKMTDGVEISLRKDKEITFNDLEEELAAIQNSFYKHTKNEDTIIGDAGENELMEHVSCNDLELELTSNGHQTDLDMAIETPKDTDRNYADILDMYRKKCMTVSENCGCISDSLMTPGRAETPAIKRHNSFSRPSSAGKKSTSRKLTRRNSFHFEKSKSDADCPKQKLLFRTPSVVSMTTDSGCSVGYEADDRIPNLCLLGPGSDPNACPVGTDSDVCVTDRSDPDKTLLEMVCDELPPGQIPETVATEVQLSDLDKEFSVVAKCVEFSKPRQEKKQKRGPAAPVAPLCFTLNARPPTGYIYYFAYGPDMSQSRITTYLKREVKERFWGLLYGFQLVFNKKGLSLEAGGFANIEYNPFCSVEGVIYQITPEELEKLDKHTGYPEHYTHLVLPVWMSNSLTPDQYGVAQYCVPAVMYIAQEKYINKDETINCDYALQQCIKSSDLVTPEYRDHMVNYCQPIKEQVMCV